VTGGDGTEIHVLGVVADVRGYNTPTRIENHGDVRAVVGDGFGADVSGLIAFSYGVNSPIEIFNDAELRATAGDGNYAVATGILGRSLYDTSPVVITNRGDLMVKNGNGDGLYTFGVAGVTVGADSDIDIFNRGDAKVTSGNGNDTMTAGVAALALGTTTSIGIENHGDLAVTIGAARNSRAFGIYANFRDLQVPSTDQPITIVNTGDLHVTGGFAYRSSVYGIFANTVYGDQNSPIAIDNEGDIVSTIRNGYAYGIVADTNSLNSPVDIINRGDVTTDGTYRAYSIDVRTGRAGSPINVVNNGNLAANVGNADFAQSGGIRLVSTYFDSPISVENRGDIVSSTGNGYYARASGIAVGTGASPIAIVNHGDVKAILGHGDYSIAAGVAANVYHYYPGTGPVSIVNTGDVEVIAGNGDRTLAAGLLGLTGFFGYSPPGNPVSIVNRGDVRVSIGNGANAAGVGIFAATQGPTSPVAIENSGSVFGGTAGIATFSYTATTIVNSGYVSASSLLAIDGGGATFFNPMLGRGASVDIINTGRIVGFVNMTDEADTFLNQAGGVFETKRTSNFFGGSDLFRNEAGATILAATNPGQRERSSFINLDRFENQGRITLQDNQVGDVFEVSNTVGGRDLNFAASGNSRLAVDAFLGPPGSTADNLIINGNVSGRTPVAVNNTNPGPGSLNTVGIPVVYVNGNVKKDAFYLPEPIDTGFFNYDMFFEPTGSGIFELRNFAGPGARLLPQIVTAAHDIWYLSSSTWLDRTADLRVLLNGGVAPIAYDPTGAQADGAPAAFTPAVWARGAGAWLDRDKSESVTAFGRNYQFNLDRELDIIDWQMGLDLGKRDFLSANDILVFGMLGGFVNADLDYDQLGRAFDFSGGQVGGYATYLKGGLFVDTLLNVHLLELETATLGFPSSLDVTTVGLRTDSGYRFGSFTGGPFIEPLATILVTWADIDGFSLAGNTVSFDDEAAWRGRLGLRVGTSTPIWGTTVLEPFVIGSLWGALSDANQATLTSTGTTFRFEDGHDDIWGEVSLGANLFTPGAGTAVFAKLDVIFGDDIDGLSGKAGMRVAW